MSDVLVCGNFDDLQVRQVRLLHEATEFGRVHVLLRSDAAIVQATGKAPKFLEAERRYFVEAIRYVDRVTLVDEVGDGANLPIEDTASALAWVVEASEADANRELFCREHGLGFHALDDQQLQGFPECPLPQQEDAVSGTPRKRVLVTGCYDWFHSGHVRFFEEVAELGELHVVVGHDANVRLLKGDHHPMYNEDHRRYMAGSIRFVHQAHISTGSGWLDAEPEIERLRPDIYAVNEDGDRPEKRAFCEAKGIEYRLLTRRPKSGLPERQSTDLRGF